MKRLDFLLVLLVLLLTLGACSGKGSGGGGSPDSGFDATAGGHCSVDADCLSQIPQTTPPGCARATCNAVAGTCVFWAKDSDGDGHATVNCASSAGVPIVVGDDCNDDDPNLYPGHSESCSTMSDGDAATGVVCVPGETSCLPDGTQSACTGTVTCVDQACVGMRCQGSCAPGTTQCSGNGIQTCDAGGQWGDPAACGAGATCVGKGGAAQCSGSCAAGATLCGGSNGVQTCSAEGTWGEPIPCINQTCNDGVCQGSCSPGQASCAGNVLVTCAIGGQYGSPIDCTAQGDAGQTCVSGGVYAFVTDGGSDGGALPAACQGSCTQWNLFCVGTQPQVCDNTGRPHNFGGTCGGVLPICVNGSCVTCPPGSQQCAGQQHQACDSNGSWQNDLPPCFDTACDPDHGCVGTCAPGALRCTPSTLDGVQICQNDGTWVTQNTCTSQTCVVGGQQGGTAPNCQGVCTYGQSECLPGKSVATCNSQGSWDVAAAACASPTPFCSVGSDGQARCTACTPGDVACATNGVVMVATGAGRSTGTTVAVCDPTGSWTFASCAAGACNRGACTVPSNEGGIPDPPSCFLGGPGVGNCGPGGSGNETCCSSDEVPGGTFYRTYTSSGDGGQNEADPATLSGFRLDRYLVTVARFRRFAAQVVTDAGAPDGGGATTGWMPGPGDGRHAYLNNALGLDVPGDAGVAAQVDGGDGGTVLAVHEQGWNPSDDVYVAPTTANLSGTNSTYSPDPGTNDNLPVNYVNWYEAYAFCIWDGGFLPSQAELEYAQAAGAEQRLYPWGSTDPGSGSQYAIYAASLIAPVGTPSQGAGAWQQLDLVGDLFEWTLDEPTSAPMNPCTDCAFLLPWTSATEHIVLGGGFENPLTSIQVPLPAAVPTYGPGTTRSADLGFRCARAP